MPDTKEPTTVEQAVIALVALDYAHGSVVHKAVTKYAKQATPGQIDSMIHTANGIARDLKRIRFAKLNSQKGTGG